MKYMVFLKLAVAVSKWNAARILFIIFESQMLDFAHEKYCKVDKVYLFKLNSD